MRQADIPFFPHTSTIPNETFHLNLLGMVFALTTLPGIWAEVSSFFF
jgi:hypothetical protein